MASTQGDLEGRVQRVDAVIGTFDEPVLTAVRNGTGWRLTRSVLDDSGDWVTETRSVDVPTGQLAAALSANLTPMVVALVIDGLSAEEAAHLLTPAAQCWGEGAGVVVNDVSCEVESGRLVIRDAQD